MEIPELQKAEKSTVFVLGEHQDEDEPKNIGELCDASGATPMTIQRGKKLIEKGFVEKEREHPDTYLYLTEDGESLLEVLKDYRELLLN